MVTKDKLTTILQYNPAVDGVRNEHAQFSPSSAWLWTKHIQCKLNNDKLDSMLSTDSYVAHVGTVAHEFAANEIALIRDSLPIESNLQHMQQVKHRLANINIPSYAKARTYSYIERVLEYVDKDTMLFIECPLKSVLMQDIAEYIRVSNAAVSFSDFTPETAKASEALVHKLESYRDSIVYGTVDAIAIDFTRKYNRDRIIVKLFDLKTGNARYAYKYAMQLVVYSAIINHLLKSYFSDATIIIDYEVPGIALPPLYKLSFSRCAMCKAKALCSAVDDDTKAKELAKLNKAINKQDTDASNKANGYSKEFTADSVLMPLSTDVLFFNVLYKINLIADNVLTLNVDIAALFGALSLKEQLHELLQYLHPRSAKKLIFYALSNKIEYFNRVDALSGIGKNKLSKLLTDGGMRGIVQQLYAAKILVFNLKDYEYAAKAYEAALDTADIDAINQYEYIISRYYAAPTVAIDIETHSELYDLKSNGVSLYEQDAAAVLLSYSIGYYSSTDVKSCIAHIQALTDSNYAAAAVANQIKKLYYVLLHPLSTAVFHNVSFDLGVLLAYTKRNADNRLLMYLTKIANLLISKLLPPQDGLANVVREHKQHIAVQDTMNYATMLHFHRNLDKLASSLGLAGKTSSYNDAKIKHDNESTYYLDKYEFIEYAKQDALVTYLVYVKLKSYVSKLYLYDADSFNKIKFTADINYTCTDLYNELVRYKAYEYINIMNPITLDIERVKSNLDSLSKLQFNARDALLEYAEIKQALSDFNKTINPAKLSGVTDSVIAKALYYVFTNYAVADISRLTPVANWTKAIAKNDAAAIAKWENTYLLSEIETIVLHTPELASRNGFSIISDILTLKTIYKSAAAHKYLKMIEYTCNADTQVITAVRDNFNIKTNVSGRMAGKGIQLLNLPKPKYKRLDATDDVSILYNAYVDIHNDVRHCIIPAAADSKIGMYDMSQAEYRVAGYVAQESFINEGYKQADFDLYESLAAKVFDKQVADVTKQERNALKIPALALIYGTGLDKSYLQYLDFAYATNATVLSLEQYTTIYRNLKNDMHSITVDLWGIFRDILNKACYDYDDANAYAATALDGYDFDIEFINTAVNNEQCIVMRIYLPTNRCIFLPFCRDTRDGLVYSAVDERGVLNEYNKLYHSKLFNYIVQSISSDAANDAVVYMLNAIRNDAAAVASGDKLILTVHDELVIEHKERDSSKYAAILDNFSKEYQIPIVFDKKVADTYIKG